MDRMNTTDANAGHMPPEQIAAKLTPAQVEAIRHPPKILSDQFHALRRVERKHGDMVSYVYDKPVLTNLGRAVLAVLDGGKA